MMLRFCRHLVMTLAVLALLLPVPVQVGPMQAGPIQVNMSMAADGMMQSDMSRHGMAQSDVTPARTCKDCGGQPMLGPGCAAQCQGVMALPVEMQSAGRIAIANYVTVPQPLFAGILRSPDPSPPRPSAIA